MDYSNDLEIANTYTKTFFGWIGVTDVCQATKETSVSIVLIHEKGERKQTEEKNCC